MSKRAKRKPGDPGPISVSIPQDSQTAADYAVLERLMIDRMGYHHPRNIQVAALAFRLVALMVQKDPAGGRQLQELLWDAPLKEGAGEPLA